MANHTHHLVIQCALQLPPSRTESIYVDGHGNFMRGGDSSIELLTIVALRLKVQVSTDKNMRGYDLP